MDGTVRQLGPYTEPPIRSTKWVCGVIGITLATLALLLSILLTSGLLHVGFLIFSAAVVLALTTWGLNSAAKDGFLGVKTPWKLLDAPCLVITLVTVILAFVIIAIAILRIV